MLLNAISQLQVQVANYPQAILLVTLWITYGYVVLKGGHCSDDIMGIEHYDGTLMYPEDNPAPGQPPKKVRKICYGTLSKWVRYHLCGGHFPSRHRQKLPDGKLGEPIESGKISTHHHTLSVICQSIAVILLYQFLLTVTTPTVALLTTLLFIVHPTCVQAVAWPSAIGYILSLICICASLLISHWTIAQTTPWLFILGVGGLAFFQIWGVYAQAIPMFTWIILLVLGQWQMALVAMVFSGLASAINLREYVVHRKEEFAKQQMGSSTSLNIRKPIVALKTLAYYLYLSILPIRLGLYHKWGFHYEKKMELWDWRAICGLLFLSSAVCIWFVSPIEIRLGLVWFVVFLTLFLNWITAQQWVTERYLYIPVIGLCLVTSFYLQHFIWLYCLILGLMASRTMSHLPTYDTELRFYLSNTWNFQTSEVAYGNLGVAYASAGLGGASNDMWVIAGSINPDYDVPYYNMFSRTKSQAMMMIQNGAYEQGLNMLAQAVPMLEKVLTCKVLHFPEPWKKECEELKGLIANPVNLLVNELGRLHTVRNSLNAELAKATDKKRIDEVIPSINDNNTQIQNLTNFLHSKGVSVDFNPERALLSKLYQPRSTP